MYIRVIMYYVLYINMLCVEVFVCVRTRVSVCILCASGGTIYACGAQHSIELFVRLNFVSFRECVSVYCKHEPAQSVLMMYTVAVAIAVATALYVTIA